jgi:glycosyltransferase involved in cell wall biosynthesis
MVSVITTTYRHGGIDIAYASLRKQTYQDFEWILLDPLYEKRKNEVKAYVRDIKLKHLPEIPCQRPQLTSVPYHINCASNQAVRAASGDYLLFYQDYIWLSAAAIEKMVNLVDPKTVVSGVGHKAQFPDHIDNPTGLISTFNQPFIARPSGISERDERLDGRSEIIPVPHDFIEANFAIFPRQLFYDIGGFHEDFDNTNYGSDNLAITMKADIMGYNFVLDKTNECVGFNQSLFPRPVDWETRHTNKGAFLSLMPKLEAKQWENHLVSGVR